MDVTERPNPQVSVILPYFEGEKWLLRSVQSVKIQQDVAWELIVVDDGSLQFPASELHFLQTDHVHPIRIDHAGKGAALNRGVSEAKADLICFIDQDDIMNPGRLKLQYDAFIDYPFAAVVYSDYERVYDNGRVIDRFISHRASSREFLRSMARKTGLVSMQTIMMKKSTFNEIGGFSTDIQLTGLDDAEFFIRLFLSNALLQYVPGLVQKWVLHQHNYSESENFQQTRLILLQHLSSLAKNYPLLRNELPHFQYHTYFMRGIFFLERKRPAEASVEFLKAIQVLPLNVNGYYLLLKSWLTQMTS